MDFLAKKMRNKWGEPTWHGRGFPASAGPRCWSGGHAVPWRQGDLGLPDVPPQPGGTAGARAPFHHRGDAQTCGWAPGPGISPLEVQIPCSAPLELQARVVETPSFLNQLAWGRDRCRLLGKKVEGS